MMARRFAGKTGSSARPKSQGDRQFGAYRKKKGQNGKLGRRNKGQGLTLGRIWTGDE
jgi:hypothetical protein